jgi:hypothetical protein
MPGCGGGEHCPKLTIHVRKQKTDK